MAKEICISSTPHETRLAILEDDQLAEIYYERENEYTLAGSIYNGRVTRVLPGMQSAFVDIGLERDAFLYVTDFLELEDQEETDELEKAATTPQRPREVHQGGDRNGRRQDRTPRERQPAAESEATEVVASSGPRERKRKMARRAAKRAHGAGADAVAVVEAAANPRPLQKPPASRRPRRKSRFNAKSAALRKSRLPRAPSVCSLLAAPRRITFEVWRNSCPAGAEAQSRRPRPTGHYRPSLQR